MVLLLANWFPFVLAGAASLFGLWALVSGRFNPGQGWCLAGAGARVLRGGREPGDRRWDEP